MAKYLRSKTAIIVIVAVGALAAIVVAATLARPISAFGPRTFWAHDGYRGYFGHGYFGEGMMSQNANWTGSVPIGSFGADMIESIKSKVNVSVGEVESAAKQAMGERSEVCCVTLAPVNGYLVFVALGIDSSNNIHRVLVDAGNGQVLDGAQVDMAGHWKYGGGMWR